MQFRGSPEPQYTRLTSRIGLLEHSDPGARRVGLSTNGYAVFDGSRFVLFDVNAMVVGPLLGALENEGARPTALVFSHRHSASLGDATRYYMQKYDIPAILHPDDADHPQARQTGIEFQDPIGHPLLEEVGVEALPWPGHTVGHIALYFADDGGVLLAGDAAMGPTAPATEDGAEFLVRPPLGTSEDDQLLRQTWEAFDRSPSTVLPYHGTGYVDRPEDMARIMAPLTRPEPTADMRGAARTA